MGTEPGREPGIAQYLRLASVLRHRIAQGELAAGARLPTVAALAAELGLARVTVRHAYGLLAREGLIHSSRGRGSFVCEQPPPSPVVDHPGEADLRIEALQRQARVVLPAWALGEAVALPSYTRLRKRHWQGDAPFCLAELYVASEVEARFPRGAATREKVVWLLQRHAPERLHQLRQTLQVLAADQPLAQWLGCGFAAPVALMNRQVLDAQGRVVMAGRFWYRGDRFHLAMELPWGLGAAHPGVAIPTAAGLQVTT